MSETMEKIEWDLKVKEALDSFDWNNVKEPTPCSTSLEASNGLLLQIGCDYESLMMELLSPETKKKEVSTAYLPTDYRPPPRYSSLSMKQQAQYLKYLEIFKSITQKKVPTKQKQAFTEYKILHRKVVQEQQEFEQYAYQVAVDRFQQYDQVPPEAKTYFKHFLSLGLKRLQQYFPLYVYHQAIPINVFPYTKDPQPKFENLSVSLGKVTQIFLPNPDVSVLVYDFVKANEVHLESIFHDENAQKLAKIWNADIVIPLSALRTLANNTPPFPNEWEMPMCVKQIEGDNGSSRSVVFMDKALPPKCVNGRDESTRYFKKAIKQFLIDYSLTMHDDNVDVEVSQKPMYEKHFYSEVDSRLKNDLEGMQSGSEYSSAETDSSSEEDIPQVDGNDDKVTEKKSTRRKTRVKSVPESVAKAADLSVWQKSFTKAPKAGTRTKSASSTISAFAQWSSKSTQVKTDPSKSLSSSKADSEDDALVIDTEDEKDNEKKEGKKEDASSSIDPTGEKNSDSEEQQEISFKATEIPSNILESVMSIDSDAVTADISTVAGQRKSSRLRSKINVDELTPKRLTRQSNKTKKETKSVDSDTDNTDKPAKKTLRKRSQKNDDLKGDSAKQSKPNKSPETEVIKKQPKRQTRSAAKGKPELKKLKRTSKHRPAMVSSHSSSNESEIETSAKALASSTLVKAQLPVIACVKVKTPSKRIPVPKSATITVEPAEKKEASPRPESQMESFAAKNTSTLAAKSTAEQPSMPKNTSTPEQREESDVIGQILSMQSGRSDKTLSPETDSNKAQQTTNQPLPNRPQDMSFDAMLQLHSSKLSVPGKSVFYTLWTIGSHRVLIRGCVHGKLKRKYHSPATGKVEMDIDNIAIRTKLEYQAALGYEQLSKSEACVEWLDLQFRPKPCTVIRCRVDPFTNKVLRFERIRNLDSAITDFEAAGFSHLKANKLLMTVFEKLKMKSYNDGSYLIYHKNGANHFAVRKENTMENSRAVVYDLLKEYANPGRSVLCTPHSIPYIPLDHFKQNQWQHTNKRVPMMFEIMPKEVFDQMKKAKKKAKQKEESN